VAGARKMTEPKRSQWVNGQYVHTATLLMAGADDDPAAPGAAITVALCGSWEHPPPCPLAAHYTGRSQDGDMVWLRIIFSTQPSDESKVRGLIDQALASGNMVSPDGIASRWTLLASGPAALSAEEREHAVRISGT
jgi:hypothetical protein